MQIDWNLENMRRSDSCLPPPPLAPHPPPPRPPSPGMQKPVGGYCHAIAIQIHVANTPHSGFCVLNSPREEGITSVHALNFGKPQAPVVLAMYSIMECSMQCSTVGYIGIVCVLFAPLPSIYIHCVCRFAFLPGNMYLVDLMRWTSLNC